MSQSLWRLLLTCMLLIALPLKGMAAVSQMPCGPGHGNADTVASVHVDAMSVDADHDEVAGQNPGQSAVVALDHGDAHGLTLGHHHDAKLKCGNCAPCCLSLAPSGSVCMVPTVRVGLGEFESQQTRYISADLGGALRPPQAHLA